MQKAVRITCLSQRRAARRREKRLDAHRRHRQLQGPFALHALLSIGTADAWLKVQRCGFLHNHDSSTAPVFFAFTPHFVNSDRRWTLFTSAFHLLSSSSQALTSRCCFAMQHTLLVVGGAGFLGSAISKAALAKGWRVLSISPSGTPYHTPAGHRPAWSSSPNIEWHAADALDPSSYAHLADRATAAVHTVGILLESDYKSKASSASPVRNAIAGVVKGWGIRLPNLGPDSNPLDESGTRAGPSARQGRFSYEHMNRDSAIAVAHTFLSSLRSRAIAHKQVDAPSTPAPFVYISAEDLFRPVVDARYIRTKRQAEAAIARLASHLQAPQREHTRDQSEAILDADGAGLEQELRDDPVNDSASPSDGQARSDAGHGLVRPVFLRPGLLYHPHTRPGSTLPAAILEASAALHRKPPLPLPLPTPAQLLARLGGGGGASESVARLLTTPPLHIDTVAKAVCAAIEDPEAFGVVDVYGIRKLAGWRDEASLNASVYAQTVAGGSAQVPGAGMSRPWPSAGQHAPLQPASRPASPHTHHTPAVSSSGQQRSLWVPSRASTPRSLSSGAIRQRRTFFGLPDLGKLASSAISSATGSSDGESRSYRDAHGRTVYETSKVLSHPADTLFSVVADVDAYKQFVPYCQDSRVLGPADPQHPAAPAVLADLTVGFGRFSETYTSKVTMTSGAKDKRSVVAEAVQPNPVFSFLETRWTFHPLPSAEGRAQTMVEFSLVYAFRNPVYGAVAGNVFEQMSAQMIDAFERRADQLHPQH
ncbi:predicted oxidoreductase [Moesziomyces antarcticus T-34]|uniref:Predicted oxidoreductase n=1 Tax=Pseudozyma antarctica (strain T-34) TaxID=1151754 RepID=M9MGL1_PSEA3|nr:predicted oxidoreductase [Moesziomyces antarcticus T-34]